MISCPFCGGLQLARGGQRRKSCPYCGKRFKVSEARVRKRFEDSRSASNYIRRIKEELRRADSK